MPLEPFEGPSRLSPVFLRNAEMDANTGLRTMTMVAALARVALAYHLIDRARNRPCAYSCVGWIANVEAATFAETFSGLNSWAVAAGCVNRARRYDEQEVFFPISLPGQRIGRRASVPFSPQRILAQKLFTPGQRRRSSQSWKPSTLLGGDLWTRLCEHPQSFRFAGLSPSAFRTR